MLDSAATTPAAAAPQPIVVEVAWLRRNAHAVIVCALYAATLFSIGMAEFVQDTWLTLSGGRDVVEHGLPWHERLTILNYGERWVDQQWLGKVFLFDVSRVGGMRLLLFVHVLFVVGALALAVAVARRRGATDSSVFWVALATIVMAPWAWQLRVQSLAYVLFVAVVALLSDPRARITRKTWLVVPLLALWANVHGSVTLAVGLTVLAAALRLRRQPVAGLALATAASTALLVSPYGIHLLDYYRSLLLNPTLSSYINEWRPASYPGALPFFAIAFATTVLAARNARILTAFEKLALIATALVSLTAIRGIIWFALAVVLMVPKLLDAERAKPAASSLVVVRAAAVACCAMVAFVAVRSLVQLPAELARAYPAPAANAVAAVAERDPAARVFASERYANWLLWREPGLAGRLAYDVRFELFSAEQFDQLVRFHNGIGVHSTPITAGARLLMLDLSSDRRAADILRTEPGSTVLFEDDNAVVFERRAG
ncbi:MAG: hypothetical protein ACJ74D_02775 [Gaiellaceae bacterium]